MFKVSKLSHLIIIIVLLCGTSFSKTRWSSLHLIPDADLFGSGEFTLGIDGLIAVDSSDDVTFRPSIPIKMGISEWFNIEVGYSGGVNLGLKARLWGETGKIMPSIAIGIHNTITNKEIGLFSVDSSITHEMSIDNSTGDTTYTNFYPVELFLAFGKTINQIKMRLHFGIQSVPTSKNDQINVFAAVEKYFGLGLYASLEFYTRYEFQPHISAFVNWRFLKKHLELSIGLVDIGATMFNDKDEVEFSLAPSTDVTFVNPGFWVGLKFHGRFGRMGKNSGFKSVEDRMRYQDEMLDKMAKQVDSLTMGLESKSAELATLKNSVQTFIDSVTYDPAKLSNIIFNKLITLKALYEAEPFEPKKVKQVVSEIRSYRDKAIVPLQRFLIDKEHDRYIRIYSAQLLGDIGATSSVDILLDVLSTAEDPDIKIEILIALGKMKETRAMFLMEQLANSPNDAIAITAQEVLFNLSKETGASIRQGMQFRKDFDTKPDALPKVQPKPVKKEVAPIIKPEVSEIPNKDSVNLSDSTASVDDTAKNDSLKDTITIDDNSAGEEQTPSIEVSKDEKTEDAKDSEDSEEDSKKSKRDKSKDKDKEDDEEPSSKDKEREEKKKRRKEADDQERI